MKAHTSSRRHLLGLGVALGLAGCGFQLRQAPDFAFDSIHVAAPPNSPLAGELRRKLAAADTLRVLDASQPREGADVVLDLTGEARDKVVVGQSASGQVREFQLRSRITFSLRTPQGRELIAPTELMQQRDISFNESAVLAKEAEENLLYRDMQSDLVQQLMQRLAALKAI